MGTNQTGDPQSQAERWPCALIDSCCFEMFQDVVVHSAFQVEGRTQRFSIQTPPQTKFRMIRSECSVIMCACADGFIYSQFLT